MVRRFLVWVAMIVHPVDSDGHIPFLVRVATKEYLCIRELHLVKVNSEHAFGSRCIAAISVMVVNLRS